MAELLRIDTLEAGHGDARVIRGVSLSVARGGMLAVLGRNGVGKTTLLDSVIGVTRRFSGRIMLNGKDISALPPDARARAGIGWVPQERAIFRSLTVDENLTATALPGPWTLPRIHALFPALAARRGIRGTLLSGGEQQMLAIGRALMLNPQLLLLDEPTEGLAPMLAAEILGTIARLGRDEGLTAIIVEQQPGRVLPLTDRAVILDRGRIVHEGPSADLLADTTPLTRHLGVSAG